MALIAYVNGRYLPITAPAVPVEERGLQFADGVYEVVQLIDGRLRLWPRHLARLTRSLHELQLSWPVGERALGAIACETARRNRLRHAAVYIQISRGAAPRDHVFSRTLAPTLIVTTRRAKPPSAVQREEGVGVLLRPDLRWGRCDIKSISLLPNSLARQEAAEAGCRETWLIDRQRGVITEASASNAYIVDRDGRLRTHPRGREILGGVTRDVVLELARGNVVAVDERPFTPEEAKTAREAFQTSSSAWVLPVTRIEGDTIGDGRPGPVTRRLMALYAEHVATA